MTSAVLFVQTLTKNPLHAAHRDITTVALGLAVISSVPGF